MKRAIITIVLIFPYILFAGNSNDIINDFNSIVNSPNVSIPKKVDNGNYNNLSVGRNSLRTVLSTLAELSGLNIFIDESVPDKRVELFVKNLEPEKAIEYVAKSNGLLVKYIDNQNIFVYPIQKKENYLGEEEIKTFKIHYLDASKLAAIIKSFSRNVKAFINEKSNSLIVFANKKQMKEIEHTLENLDKRVPQIMLDVKMLEVQTDALDKLGLKFSDPLSSVKFPDLHPGSTGIHKVSLVGPDALYEALKKTTNAKLLARPKIMLMLKKDAKIRLGDRIPVEIISSETSDGINRENNRIEWIDSGIKLEATLQKFNSKDEATISVKSEISTPVNAITTTKSNIPQLRTREADTSLRLKNGETVVLGGLISSSESNIRTKPPLLSRLPLIGGIFKRRKLENTKTEIVIFITPKFIK
jgi:general secretion pathway protein D